ncbi:SRPBCC domain-containing protein [Sediminicoccus sp. KRV36]|uniref:SRPBCC family protein n=1 Tax=Sediminicoccus sp. KRV36 TaxID=3133721 RepID=UPI00200FB0BD|nr:SRPBCC domain-containing protein [Sediminicoccus rosea]UPY36569.1 SRPBCC domain-containing protein [Sediminicoccus rosea]
MTDPTSLTLVRRLKAPPERVWQAWTDPALMLRWFGPHHTQAEAAEGELRLGGGFRVVLREDNGERHEALGRYTEITPPTRLVFAWNWASMPERVSRVTVQLRAVPEGTELTLTHDRFADSATATRHTRGWTESLEKLLALIGAAA